jgi:hypothetical protein
MWIANNIEEKLKYLEKAVVDFALDLFFFVDNSLS